MWTTLGEVLPLAVGLALSPFAVVTGVVLLLGDRGRDRAALFGVDVVQLLLGALFLGLAAMSWRKRPPEGEHPREAKMLDRLTTMSPIKALGLGAAQGLLVIKNLPLAVGAGATIGGADLSGGSTAVVVVAFAVIATGGVIVPLLVSMAGGAKASSMLLGLRRWLETNLTAVTVVILVLLGAVFLGNGLSLLD